MKVLRLSGRRRSIFLNVTAIIISCIFLFPLYWLIISSLKTNAEIFQSPQTLFPSQIQFTAYYDQLFGPNSIIGPFLNSLIIATSSMIVSMLLGVPAAYGLARFKIKGGKLFILTFLITQMLPATLVLTPLFLIYKGLGFLNTFLAPIFSDSTIAIPFIVLILRPYFLSLPKDLEDSAKIDGCNTFTAFVRIMLPLSYPGLITAISFAFLFAWNDLIYAMTFMNIAEMRPLTAGIYHFMDMYGTEWNKIMAYGMFLVAPVIIIFVFLQKYIVSGLISGSVKG